MNDEMILSEIERRMPGDACWSELDICIQNFGEKVQLARRQVCYTQDCGPPTAESIERHTRRMAHLFFVEQHARTVLALRPVHRQPVVEWTWAGVATAIVQTVCTCVEIKILRRVRAEPSRRPPRHRRDACSMAWRCRLFSARPSQDGRVIAEK